MALTASKKETKKNHSADQATLLKAWELMCTAKALTDIYEANFKLTSKYVHATSRGHEAVQLALGMQLKAQDFVAPYYRDDSILLGIGMEPYELMLQLMAKRDDPFSGGRTYYGHPSLRREGLPKIPHQSSATGMQAIPTTGIALGLWYKEQAGIPHDMNGSPAPEEAPVVVCSLGDASITEGEVAEALQMAVLEPRFAILDETDSGLDIDALRIVANGVNKLKRPDTATIVVTHYQRLLEYIVPDFVHVLANGRIVKSGGKELALELEAKGYDWLLDEPAAVGG